MANSEVINVPTSPTKCSRHAARTATGNGTIETEKAILGEAKLDDGVARRLSAASHSSTATDSQTMNCTSLPSSEITGPVRRRSSATSINVRPSENPGGCIRNEVRQSQIQKQEDHPIMERRESVKSYETESGTVAAELRRNDLERLGAEQEAAASKESTLSSYKKTGSLARRFGTVKSYRNRSLAALHTIVTSARQSTIMDSIKAPQHPESPQNLELKSNNREVEREDESENGTPASFSYAEERLVRIRYNQSIISLPVTHKTTPLELVRNASKVLSENIPISYSNLLESFDRLGLERPIRSYERIYDIIDSWNGDSQNNFVLEVSNLPVYNYDFTKQQVPRFPPNSLTLSMYHSQRPGEWTKCYVTLLSTGQIFMSQRADSNVKDHDVVKICHLSEFDIYTPASRQGLKSIRTPKTICYALKKQQKPESLFDVEPLVHLFSSDNEDVARRWYSTVQQWRSWYLVYHRGKGEAGGTARTNQPSHISTGLKSNYAYTKSVNRSLQTSGMFESSNEPERCISPSSMKMVGVNPYREIFPQQNLPHSQYSGYVASPSQDGKYSPFVDFVPLMETGIRGPSTLQRSYTQRQQTRKEMERETAVQGFLMNPPGSQALQDPGRSLSLPTRSIQRSETLRWTQRSNSYKQSPLLDFTPTFKEAPQWDKSKKGHGVKGVPGLPLVELATGPRSQDHIGDQTPKALFNRQQYSPTRDLRRM